MKSVTVGITCGIYEFSGAICECFEFIDTETKERIFEPCRINDDLRRRLIQAAKMRLYGECGISEGEIDYMRRHPSNFKYFERSLDSLQVEFFCDDDFNCTHFRVEDPEKHPALGSEFEEDEFFATKKATFADLASYAVDDDDDDCNYILDTPDYSFNDSESAYF